jgi:hypothetical protein
MHWRLGFVTFICASLWWACAWSQGNIIGGGVWGDIKRASSSYQGPGDVYSGSTAWGSCARAYNAAYANGTNLLCDLVASGSGAAVGSLRVLTGGVVDLTAYFSGSTPPVACAAASGGSCAISKVYDNTGNSNHWVQATLANMPLIAFNIINGLPAINCGNGTPNNNLQTTNTFTQSQPITMSMVYQRNGNTSAGNGFFGNGSNNAWIGSNGAANLGAVQFGNIQNVTAADNAWHGLQGLGDGASGASNIDGTDNSGIDAGSNGFSANTLRFCRAGTFQSAGYVAEGGYWPVTSTSTNRNALFANQNGANGYNGAL